MKKVTVVFLCINIVLMAFYALLFGFVAIVATLASANTDPSVDSPVLMAIIMGVMTIVMIPLIIYNVYLLRQLNKATCKSDIKTWQKVFAFFFSGIVVGILLCCLGEDDFEPEQPAVAQSKSSAFDELMKYKFLLDEGLITREEFDAQKAKILK